MPLNFILFDAFNTPGVNSKYAADYINGYLFDQYSPSDRIAIIDDLKSELQRIHQIIGSPDSLRQHFLMDEKAVASAECQNAMTSTAIEKGMSLLYE